MCGVRMVALERRKIRTVRTKQLTWPLTQTKTEQHRTVWIERVVETIVPGVRNVRRHVPAVMVHEPTVHEHVDGDLLRLDARLCWWAKAFEKPTPLYTTTLSSQRN